MAHSISSVPEDWVPWLPAQMRKGTRGHKNIQGAAGSCSMSRRYWLGMPGTGVLHIRFPVCSTYAVSQGGGHVHRRVVRSPVYTSNICCETYWMLQVWQPQFLQKKSYSTSNCLDRTDARREISTTCEGIGGRGRTCVLTSHCAAGKLLKDSTRPSPRVADPVHSCKRTSTIYCCSYSGLLECTPVVQSCIQLCTPPCAKSSSTTS